MSWSLKTTVSTWAIKLLFLKLNFLISLLVFFLFVFVFHIIIFSTYFLDNSFNIFFIFFLRTKIHILLVFYANPFVYAFILKNNDRTSENRIDETNIFFVMYRFLYLCFPFLYSVIRYFYILWNAATFNANKCNDQIRESGVQSRRIETCFSGYIFDVVIRLWGSFYFILFYFVFVIFSCDYSAVNSLMNHQQLIFFLFCFFPLQLCEKVLLFVHDICFFILL